MAALLCACLHTRSYLTERLALPMQLIAECFCIYNDQNTSEAMAYDKSLGFRWTWSGWMSDHGDRHAIVGCLAVLETVASQALAELGLHAAHVCRNL